MSCELSTSSLESLCLVIMMLRLALYIYRGLWSVVPLLKSLHPVNGDGHIPANISLDMSVPQALESLSPVNGDGHHFVFSIAK